MTYNKNATQISKKIVLLMAVSCAVLSIFVSSKPAFACTTADKCDEAAKLCKDNGGVWDPTVSNGTCTEADKSKNVTEKDYSNIFKDSPRRPNTAKFQCGKGQGNDVKTEFDFGCIGGDATKFSGATLNPILDIAFAIFRFLSAGVGLIVIGSIVVAGIQYTTSRGDPQQTAAAIKRISNSLIGLLLYVFMFAIANFLVPGGMFL